MDDDLEALGTPTATTGFKRKCSPYWAINGFTPEPRVYPCITPFTSFHSCPHRLPLNRTTRQKTIQRIERMQEEQFFFAREAGREREREVVESSMERIDDNHSSGSHLLFFLFLSSSSLVLLSTLLWCISRHRVSGQVLCDRISKAFLLISNVSNEKDSSVRYIKIPRLTFRMGRERGREKRRRDLLTHHFYALLCDELFTRHQCVASWSDF